jgi:hypothetical protein
MPGGPNPPLPFIAAVSGQCRPSGFRTIYVVCYQVLGSNILNRLIASSGWAELMLIYANFYLGSPQKSPQEFGSHRTRP